MIDRGWKIAEPVPDAQGRLFNVGGSGSQNQIQAPPGKDLLSSTDLQQCAAKSQKKVGTRLISAEHGERACVGGSSIGIVALLVVGGAVVYFSSSGSSSSSKPLLITAVAVPRDLRDEVTVQGTLERVEERTINSVSEASQVSKVFLKDGANLSADESILALDGRSSVTTDGSLAFFRRLDIGAEGEDVAQLNQTLAAAGYSPGASGAALHRADELRAGAVAGRARLSRRRRRRPARRCRSRCCRAPATSSATRRRPA